MIAYTFACSFALGVAVTFAFVLWLGRSGR